MDGYEEIDILSCNSMIFRKAYDSGNKCLNVNLVRRSTTAFGDAFGSAENKKTRS